VALYPTIITTLGVLALVAVALALGLFAALASPGGRNALRGALGGMERHPIGWAWGVALTAMLGSLYLSEIMHFLPCLFCWYQRIAMYPLVFVLGVGILRSDPGVWRYAIPLPVVGFLIAAYHVVIQWRPTLDVGTCAVGAPCTGRYVAVFGYISIPTMAGAAFLLITALMLLVRTLEQGGDTPGEGAA
jgi:disulfide bond formation protein DsbB